MPTIIHEPQAPKQTYTISLASGGTVTLIAECDMLQASTEDVTFLRDLVYQMREHGA